jgi:hypothetical protein
MVLHLLIVVSYLSLIISEALLFCTWLDANSILHGILLLCQALWVLCFGRKKPEHTREESVWLQQPAQETPK